MGPGRAREPFWFDDSRGLYQATNLLPAPEMDWDQCLNAFTRLLIVAAVVLFMLGIGRWWLLLLLGLGLVLILHFIVSRCSSATGDSSLRHTVEHQRDEARGDQPV